MTLKVSLIYQITEEDIKGSLILNKGDIGKWCYLLNGHYRICNSKEEAEQEEQKLQAKIPASGR
jgi:hypothetical protein